MLSAPEARGCPSSPLLHEAPDPDILPLCNALNELQDICTYASCSGHQDGRGGRLLLRLGRDTSAAFDRRALELAARSRIRMVSKRYTADRGELVEIAFAGNDTEHLGEAAGTILSFFRRLVHEIQSIERWCMVGRCD
ncbi:MAG TPA: hypothetical protein VJV23_16865 [Candidatus Polarisedimenticolia bacterium]|nr:hypothetical protein [Candidatus Polarisedimenticolia bacterium]